MTAMATRRVEYPMTAAEFGRRTFPEGKEELDRGFVVREPAPGGDHGAIVVEVAHRLRSHVRDAGLGGAVLAGTGFVLARNPDQVRVPDVAYVAAGRPRGRGLIEGPADLAVEVLSPNRPEEIAARIGDQFRAGARLFWVVDPDARTVTVHYPDGTRVLLGGDDTLDGGDVLPGLEIRVGELFRG